MYITTEIEREQYAQPPRELARHIDTIANSIPPGATVSLEGPPLYNPDPWTGVQDYGYNHILSWIWERLGREHDITHIALIDDINRSGATADHQLLEYITRRPQVVYLESDFVPQAEMQISQWLAQGRAVLTGEMPVITLPRVGRLALRNHAGIPACPLLDALFQQQKNSRFHHHTSIVIHPVEFSDEQIITREVLSLLGDSRLPFEQIWTLFYHEKTPRKLLYTDQNNHTKLIRI